ncbi:MAG: helix-turn-helix domain-containing protein [Tannerellaceae bacterium]|nr:helix-turn-helix domain-containing protein [Tannerellaceae bacterium]
MPDERGTLLAWCVAGKLICKISGERCEISPDYILLASSTDIDTVEPLTKTKFEGTIIYVSESIFVNRQRLYFRKLRSAEIDELTTLIQLIDTEINKVREVRVRVVESLLRALIISIQNPVQASGNKDTGVPAILRNFARLISRYHHSPAYFYAEKLEVSTLKLNNYCRRYSDMSAAEWISKYVLLEANDLLTKTNLRPGQIATMLGFSNHDTFTRWFRRNTGKLPMDIR